MSYSYAAPLTGTFVSNGASQLITLPGFTDILKFEVWDETQFGLASANTDMLSAWFYKDMAAGSAYVQNRVSGSAADITTNMVTSNGFTLIDPTGPQLQASITGTTITQAGPAVASATQTFNSGDVVRITNSTGMLQIAGVDFTVTKINGSSFSLTNLDSTGFAAGATAFKVQKLNFQAPYYPKRRTITNVGASAGSSIITLSVTHGYTVGQAVRIYMPSTSTASGTNPFTPVGILGTSSNPPLVATITAIGAADASGFTNTITVNVNSSGFTFGWPTSAQAASGVQLPFVEPVGEAATVPYQNLLDDATVNQGVYQMQLGSSVCGVASDVVRWFAWRGDVQS